MVVLKTAACTLFLCVFASVPVSAQQLAEIDPATAMNAGVRQNALSSPNQEGADADSQPASVFQTTVRNLFNEEKFAKLDEIADVARSQKSRFPGGAWKLHSFYGAIQGPGSLTATDAVWEAHMQRLQSWIDSKPDSSTPRVALAEAYLRFAWKARGNGQGDKVTTDGWKLFRERVQKAEDVLEQAKSVSTKDPQWYQAMQTVALAQGWDQKRAEQLVVEANGVEPGYYYFYSNHANYLLPNGMERREIRRRLRKRSLTVPEAPRATRFIFRWR